MDLVTKWNRSHKKVPSDKTVSEYAVHIAKDLISKAHILDLGGGRGEDTKYFLKHGFQVTLVDISDFALSVAKEWAESHQYPLKTLGVTLGEEVFDLEEKVDVVYSRMALHYFDYSTTVTVLKQILNTLKEGGKAFIVVKSSLDINEMKYLKEEAELVEENVYRTGEQYKSRFTKLQCNIIYRRPFRKE